MFRRSKDVSIKEVKEVQRRIRKETVIPDETRDTNKTLDEERVL